jgi:heptosyltransferase II
VVLDAQYMEVLKKGKILVIQTAFIGDAILTLPMIQKLKEIFPLSFIDVVCIPGTEEIFKACPVINDVIVFDKRGKQKSFLKLLKFARNIKGKKYSRIYSPHRSFRTAFLIWFSGVKETFGFSNTAMSYIFKYIIDYHLNKHEVQRNFDLIGFDYNEDNWKILPVINATNDIKQKVSLFLQIFANRNIIAIAPGAVWETKKYPKKYYSEIIKFLVNKNYSVVLIGGQPDAGLCEEIAYGFKENVVSSAGQFSIPGTVELVKHCKLLITNDSAPTHMAMAADIPTLTIYCSTIPGFGFYPYSKKSFSITFDQLECKPCGIHGYNNCPIKTFDCANKIDIDRIKKSILDILNE